MVLVTGLCILVQAANCFGMEFRWGPIDSADKSKAKNKEIIYLTGEIRRGDYNRFRLFMLENLPTYSRSVRSVRLSSNGGDILEALRIGEILKAMYATVDVPLEGTCVSACFLLYVSAVERSAPSGRLGVHRAYFDKTYFAGLNPRKAEERQLELTKALTSFLEKNSVPRAIVDKMNQTSSATIHWLNQDEIDELGAYAPWFEEFLIAKCGIAPKTLEKVDLLFEDEKRYFKFVECRDKKIDPEMESELRKMLKDSATSPKKPSQ